MKKRLRKKKCVGEFRERGFLLEYRLEAGVWDADKVLDDFIEEVERRGLACGGCSDDDSVSLIIQRATRGSVTEAERAALAAWCECEPQIAAYRAAPLVWHDRESPSDDASLGEWVVKPRFSCS